MDRAVVLAMAPKEKSFPPGWCRILDEEAQSNIETVAVKMEQLFDNLYFAGDAYPMWYPNLGPGVLTAFTGSRIFYDVNKSTSWQEHSVLALEDYHPQLQTDGLWAKTLEINKFISRLAAGKFIAGICDLGTGADLISNVIGPEALCMEIMDNPEQIKRILKEFLKYGKPAIPRSIKSFRKATVPAAGCRPGRPELVIRCRTIFPAWSPNRRSGNCSGNCFWKI